MALESEYFPAQTSRLNSLTPEERSANKRVVWGLFGVYTAAVAIMGVVVLSNTSFQKPDAVVVAATLQHR